MSQPYTGGCACGAIRYAIAAEPMMMSDCQCRQCQRQSGTGHSSYLNFPRAAVTLEGEGRAWEVTGEGGTMKSCAFCPTCGSPVYMTFPAMPDLFIVRAGSLDDPSRYQPQMVFWTSASQSWDHIDSALQKFDKLPPR